ncbi:hypothetical protein CRENPOLYSF1_430001 [Crenothrix polyspora]|uniref:Dystroglycan-type cadherin-like domain-containing protein n=1 Tax=Crenothrix polyspora TaxID=360316 RepID=A0A1R4HAI0_9GAMM|nr:hypothetical protein CRENPOLYSF1_430001 [Crenothrix polyspora]
MPNGVVTVAVDGTLSFKPVLNYTGPVSFDYVVKDPSGLSDIGTVNLNVTPVNDAPVAVDDGTLARPLPIVEDTATPLNLLANDTDVDGDVLTVKSINGIELILGTAQSIAVPNGVVTVAVDGSLSFKPVLNYTGPVSFDYVVKDPSGLSDMGTVNLNVTPVNDAPVAVDDGTLALPLPIVEDTATPLNLLANDTDVDGDVLTVKSINGIELIPGTAQSIAVPNGVVTVAVDGSLSFKPVLNYTGPVSFDYVVKDPSGLSDIGTVNLNVTPVNDAPVAVDDGTLARPLPIVEDTATPLNLLGNDTDVDGDALTVKSINGIELIPGTAQSIAVPSGVVTVAVDGSLSFKPVLNYTGPVSFDYVVKDPSGLSDVGTVNLNVTPVNDAPVAVDDNVPVLVNTPVTGNVLDNDSDLDGDKLLVGQALVDVNGDGTPDVLVLGTATALTDKTGNPIGTLTLNSDGSFNFKPANNYTGAVPVVEYTLSDGNGATDVALLNLGNIKALNAPTVEIVEDANNDGFINAAELVGLVDVKVSLPANAKAGDRLMVTDGIKPYTRVLTATDIVAANVDVTFVAPADGKTISVTAQITDSAGNLGPVSNTDSAKIDITAPLTAELNPASDSGVLGDTKTNDTTPTIRGTGMAGDTITVISPTGEKLTTLVAADGTWQVTPEIALPNGAQNFSVTATDPVGNVSTPIAVAVIIDTDIILTAELKPETDSGVVGDGLTDKNPPAISGTGTPGDAITVTSPSGEILHTLVDGDGNWSVNPVNLLPVGIKQTYVVVSHDSVDNNGKPINVDVTIVPTIVPKPDTVDGAIDTPIKIDILANDPKTDPTTIKLVGTAKPGDPLVVPGQGTWTVDRTTGVITFTPLATFHGAPTPIEYTVTNAKGEVSANALIKIKTPPSVTNDVVNTQAVNTPITVDVLANDKDVDPTTVQIDGTTELGNPLLVPGQGLWTVDKTTGQLTFTPLATFNGDPTPINYTVKSPSGLVSGLAGVTIHILPPEIGSLILLVNQEPPLFTMPVKTLPFTVLPVRPLTPMWEHEWFKPLHLSLFNNAEQCELYLTGSLKNQFVIERQPYHFSIPAGTFRHTNPSEQLEYKATHPNGSPLPEWLKFDAKTLTFFGVPPKGTLSETVMITVRDSCGDEVHATFFVKVSKEHQHHTSRDKAHGFNKGKLGLSNQLHAAGKMGRLQQGRELLDSLAADKNVENVTILKSQKG